MLKLIPQIKYFLCRHSSIKSNNNIVEKNKLIFIHNPKVAGNSLIKVIGIQLNEKESTSHQTPTFLVNKKTWETHFSILAVRDPIDRLISSFNYHTKKSYKGYFLTKYPDLHQFSFKKYFEVFSKEPYVIIPQVNYTRHLMSKKIVDYIIYYENLQDDVENLCKLIEIEDFELPHLNQSPKREINYFDDITFRDKVINYYREDFSYFGYKIKL
jgi:hypothetical protein